MNGSKKRSAFSLVELMIGMVILLLVTLFTVSIVLKATKSNRTNARTSQIDFAVNSLFDVLRERCGSEWATLEWTAPRLELEKPDFRLESTVSTIDPNTRTRTATAIVSYLNNGTVVKVKTYTVLLQQIRGKPKGSRLMVKAVDTNGVPIANVKIRTQGAYTALVNNPEKNSITNALGILILTEVKVHAVGIPVTADGSAQLCYFVGSPNSFTKTVTSPPIPLNTIVDMTASPFVLTCPDGKIAGYVEDISGAPFRIPNYEIRIISKNGGLAIPTYHVDITTRTDAAGNYFVDKLMAGKYGIYPIGNPSGLVDGTYPALAKPRDYWEWNDIYNMYVTVPDSGFATGISTFSSLPMGSVSGRVYFAESWNGTNFSTINNPAQNQNVSLGQLPVTFAYSPPGIDFNLYETNAWWLRIRASFYSAIGYEWPSYEFPTDASGHYSKSKFMPRLVHWNHSSYNLHQQYNWLYFTPARLERASGNAIPVTITNPNGVGPNHPRAAVRIGGDISSVLFFPKTVGGATVGPSNRWNDIAEKVNLNATVNKDLYLLHKNQLVQIDGTINGTPPFSGTIDVQYGNLQNAGGVRTWITDYYVDPNFSFQVNSGGDFNSGRWIIPNFSDSDQLQLTYKKETTTLQTNSLTADVTFYTKKLLGTVKYVGVDPSYLISNPVTIPQITFYYARTWGSAFTVNNVSVTSSNDLTAASSQFQKNNTYKSVQNKNIQPGGSYTWTFNMPATAITDWEPYFVKVTGNPSEYVWTWVHCCNPGPYAKYSTPDLFYKLYWDQSLADWRLYFNRILQGTLSGTLTWGGTPIPGRVATLERTGFPNMTATTAANGTYSFSNFSFTAEPGINWKVTFALTSGCTTAEESGEGYEGLSKTFTHVVNCPPGGPGL